MITRFLRLAGFLGLVLLTVGLLFHSFLEALSHHGVLTPIVILNLIIFIGLVYTLAGETAAWAGSENRRAPFGRGDPADFLAVLGGTVATFFLSSTLGLGPVTAAGLAGIAAALVLPRHATPIYCGAFAGMACPQLFGCTQTIVPAGAIAGIFYVLAGKSLAGFGGKLGTIAFGGTLAMVYLGGQQPYSQPIPEWEAGILILTASLAAVLATYYLSVRAGHGPVLASAAVGLTGGLVLPTLLPGNGPMLAIMVICASFAGMSAPARVGKSAMILVAGLFCGIVFMYTAPCFGGTGGKLGTIAFGSVISARGLLDLGAVSRDRLLAHRASRRRMPGPR